MRPALDVTTSPLAHRIADISTDTAAPIQRYTAEQTAALILEKFPEDYEFLKVAVSALRTIAAKSGQALPAFLAGKSNQQVEAMIDDLRTGPRDERTLWERIAGASDDVELVPSEAYAGMNRVSRTNILVKNDVKANDANLKRFVQRYTAGTMRWYRGISVAHFSYAQLKRNGVLASEGTADVPTFTMGNNTPTRWLPGLYDATLAEGVASTVSATEPGMRGLLTTNSIPIGVTVQIPIAPPLTIAYLNDGEQVVRGPITGATVYRVVLLGPFGYSYKLSGGKTADLPPEAPYQAAVGSDEITAWANAAHDWVVSH